PLAFTTRPRPIPPVPPNPTLIAHPQYPGYGYFPSDPTYLYRLPQSPSVAVAGPPRIAPDAPAQTSTAQISIDVVNAGRPGAEVDDIIARAAHRIEGGGRHSLAVGSTSTIPYDRGDGLGTQRYALSAGVYEFRPTASGWALFKHRSVRADGREQPTRR